mmetsp:Transcript_88615/g.228551  ORF Transcript_88615/g.228551 Transcript_88615/m.228551 type:complete len:244 (+) Transcript_88615:384-1115(+)
MCAGATDPALEHQQRRRPDGGSLEAEGHAAAVDFVGARTQAPHNERRPRFGVQPRELGEDGDIHGIRHVWKEARLSLIQADGRPRPVLVRPQRVVRPRRRVPRRWQGRVRSMPERRQRRRCCPCGPPKQCGTAGRSPFLPRGAGRPRRSRRLGPTRAASATAEAGHGLGRMMQPRTANTSDSSMMGVATCTAIDDWGAYLPRDGQLCSGGHARLPARRGDVDLHNSHLRHLQRQLGPAPGREG